MVAKVKFTICADTDVGTKKEVNQDSVLIKKMSAPIGPMALAVLCDGMGGLQYGEVASMSIISAFSQWADYVLPELARQDIPDHVLRTQWEDLLRLEHEKLAAASARLGAQSGSTVVALLVTQTRYYALNIGDSRLYRLDRGLTQLTRDHTVVEGEIQRGNLTARQAESSPMRSVLTRCVGVGAGPRPDMFFGRPEGGETFLLCSDGFRHRVSGEEIYQALRPEGGPLSRDDTLLALRYLIDENKRRGERDNISAAAVTVWPEI